MLEKYHDATSPMVKSRFEPFIGRRRRETKRNLEFFSPFDSLSKNRESCSCLGALENGSGVISVRVRVRVLGEKWQEEEGRERGN